VIPLPKNSASGEPPRPERSRLFPPQAVRGQIGRLDGAKWEPTIYPVVGALRVLTLELAHLGRGRQVREVGSESFEVSVAKHGRRCISPSMTLRLCASNSTDGPADVSKWGDLASGTNSKEA
jgi:hypothetical protein